MDNINKRISELINKFCAGNNSKFAELIGTSEANVRNYKTGTIPKIDVINSIVDVFEVSYEWLLAGNGSMLKENASQTIAVDDRSNFTNEIERLKGLVDELMALNKNLSESNKALSESNKTLAETVKRGELQR